MEAEDREEPLQADTDSPTRKMEAARRAINRPIERLRPRMLLWQPPEGEYVVTYPMDNRGTEIECLNGVDWIDAPIPPHYHACYPQMRAWHRWFERVFRCACGSLSFDGRYWMERNSRQGGDDGGAE